MTVTESGPKAVKRDAKRAMSQDHKNALARGREARRAVQAYLEALEVSKPRRGRKVTAESLRSRIEAMGAELSTADPAKRLLLIQRKRDAEEALRAVEAAPDTGEAEANFVKVAKEYSESKGITWTTWREVGVKPSILKEAGIER